MQYDDTIEIINSFNYDNDPQYLNKWVKQCIDCYIDADVLMHREEAKAIVDIGKMSRDPYRYLYPQFEPIITSTKEQVELVRSFLRRS